MRIAIIAGLTALLVSASCFAQEAVLEEIKIETTSLSELELRQEKAIQQVIDRLQLRAETQRSIDLEIANRTPLINLLNLTRYSPIPLGGSDSRVDTFFLENSMRPDLNPREDLSFFKRGR
jgi:hypothetical protein